jgi:hypothetical protein
VRAQGIVVWRKADCFHTADIPLGRDLVTFIEGMGWKCIGITEGRHLREELRDKPEFEGLCGPMWGGEESPLRYETWEAYEVLSR